MITRKLFVLAFVVVFAALALAACGGDDDDDDGGGGGAEEPIVVGITTAKSGALEPYDRQGSQMLIQRLEEIKSEWSAANMPAHYRTALDSLAVTRSDFAVLLYWTNWERVQEIYLFALVLLIQSLPFLAAAGIAALEGSRLNDFAFWIGLRGRLTSLVPGRAVKPLTPDRLSPM